MSRHVNYLLRRYAYETGDFLLASGARSSEYLDVKNAILQPTAGWDLAMAASEQFGTARAIAGVAIGGAMLARLVAGIRSLPSLVVRPEIKSHGNRRHVDGLRNLTDFNEEGDAIPITLIEDVVTSGESVVKALHALAKEAKTCKVTDCVIVCDRQAGGMDYLKQEFPGIKFHVLTTLSAVRETGL
jgi:orotate phosphoribosyltransferase